LKKALRGDVGRQKRRFSLLGEVNCRIYQGGETEQAVRALPVFLKTHAQRWPAAYKAPGFHERLVRAGLAANLLHFSELQVNGRPCSWHLGFVWKGRFYYHLPAIDSEFAAYSPGKLHLLSCVQDAIRMRLKVFDFLRGDEAYKSGWANGTVALHAYNLHRPALPSRMRDLFVEQVKPRLAR
jgi:CelD/BcsL family acetyltransferase involved in cellulose biosynthesis